MGTNLGATKNYPATVKNGFFSMQGTATTKGVSEECALACTKVDACLGYMVRNRKQCGLIEYPRGAVPFDLDSTSDSHDNHFCFKRDTEADVMHCRSVGQRYDPFDNVPGADARSKHSTAHASRLTFVSADCFSCGNTFYV